jgi:hypothetical protein
MKPKDISAPYLSLGSKTVRPIRPFRAPNPRRRVSGIWLPVYERTPGGILLSYHLWPKVYPPVESIGWIYYFRPRAVGSLLYDEYKE